MITYIFKCGHRAAEPANKKTKKGNNRYACPECGDSVDAIEVKCNICHGIELITPGGRPSSKCKKHRHLLTAKEAAGWCGVSVATIRTYAWQGKIRSQKVGKRVCLTKNQIKNFREKINPQRKAKKRIPCDKYNCAHRTACLGTEQFYQACDQYQAEYAAGDFSRRVATDIYDQVEGVAGM